MLFAGCPSIQLLPHSLKCPRPHRPLLNYIDYFIVWGVGVTKIQFQSILFLLLTFESFFTCMFSLPQGWDMLPQPASSAPPLYLLPDWIGVNGWNHTMRGRYRQLDDVSEYMSCQEYKTITAKVRLLAERPKSKCKCIFNAHTEKYTQDVHLDMQTRFYYWFQVQYWST